MGPESLSHWWPGAPAAVGQPAVGKGEKLSDDARTATPIGGALLGRRSQQSIRRRVCLVTDMQRLVEKLNAAFGREHDAHLHAFGGRIPLDDLESDLRMHVVVLGMFTHPLVGLRAHIDAGPAA